MADGEGRPRQIGRRQASGVTGLRPIQVGLCWSDVCVVLAGAAASRRDSHVPAIQVPGQRKTWAQEGERLQPGKGAQGDEATAVRVHSSGRRYGGLQPCVLCWNTAGASPLWHVAKSITACRMLYVSIRPGATVPIAWTGAPSARALGTV